MKIVDRIVQVLCVVMFVSAILISVVTMSPASSPSRNYHPYAIADIAAQSPSDWHGHYLTHIQIEGWVAYRMAEGDGDRHIRVCDSTTFRNSPMDAAHCMVAECIPKLPCDAKPGQHVRVQGIGRYDAENPGHHWWEVHPVENIEVLP